MRRPILVTGLIVAVLGLAGCDDKPSAAEALAQAEAKDKADKEKKAKEKAAAKPAPKDPNAVEMPWTADTMKSGLTMGMTLDYAVTGTGPKGKPFEDTLHGIVKAVNPGDVGVTSYLESQSKEPIATQVATHPWSRFSPFFAVETAEHKLLRKESVDTPAGKFDCIVVELEGFFGAHHTVWMIVDKPGVYAQVVDHGNAKDEADQTELTYVLTTIGAK